MVAVLKFLAALLSAVPALARVAGEVRRMMREREAARQQEEKDARNEAAIREAQKALEPKEGGK